MHRFISLKSGEMFLRPRHWWSSRSSPGRVSAWVYLGTLAVFVLALTFLIARTVVA
jgi:hypothetical protein